MSANTSSIIGLITNISFSGIVDPADSALQNNGKTGKVHLYFDALLTEAPKHHSTPTKYPVESGVNISDHVVKEPPELALTGVITNTPVSLVRSTMGAVESLFGTSENPVKDADEYFTNLVENGQPCDIVTGLKIYKTYVCDGYETTQTVENGSNALDFSLHFTHINVVQSQTVQVPEGNMDDAVGASGASESDTGKQATQEPTAPEADKGSLWYQQMHKIMPEDYP